MKINTISQNINFKAKIIKGKGYKTVLKKLSENNEPIAFAIEESLSTLNKKDTKGKYKIDVIGKYLLLQKLIKPTGTFQGEIINNNRFTVMNLLTSTPQSVKNTFNNFIDKFL